MKLYFAPRTRAIRPRWLLEELGLPYELVKIDLLKQENKTPAYLAVQPLGELPALVDGDVTLFESLAICLYLADQMPEKKLAPPIGSICSTSSTLRSTAVTCWLASALPQPT